MCGSVIVNRAEQLNIVHSTRTLSGPNFEEIQDPVSAQL